MTNAAKTPPNSWSQWPDADGRFGEFGGRYVAETLMPALLELEQAYLSAHDDPTFQAELSHLLRSYVGRPTPLTPAPRLAAALSEACGQPGRKA